MENNKPQFGISETRRSLEDLYLNRWIVVYTSYQQTTFTGKFKEITEDGYLVLQPFQGTVCDSDRGLIRKLVDEPSLISTANHSIVAIEPTTEEVLEAYCEKQNEQLKKQQELKESK
ncbi:MAG: hypothetical protein ABIG37_02795 [Nanoarchaeota archaeon]|nr:hypothetical protein [Nanoarchaeota archaeon]